MLDESLRLLREREAHKEAKADLLQTVRERYGRKSSVQDSRHRRPDERTSASQGGNRIELKVRAPKTATAYSSSRHERQQERPKSKKMKTSPDYSRSRQKKSKAFAPEDHEDQTAPKRREKEDHTDKKKNKKKLKRKRTDSFESYTG